MIEDRNARRRRLIKPFWLAVLSFLLFDVRQSASSGQVKRATTIVVHPQTIGIIVYPPMNKSSALSHSTNLSDVLAMVLEKKALGTRLSPSFPGTASSKCLAAVADITQKATTGVKWHNATAANGRPTVDFEFAPAFNRAPDKADANTTDKHSQH